METRTLANFLKVAEIGSISAAAESLNIAQPVLSRQIAGLEHELDAKLFERHGRGVTLTEAGAVLRERAAAILGQLEQARHEVSATATEPTGTVSLGLPPSMLYVLSGPVVAAYSQRYPKVALRVYEGVSQYLEEWLVSGQTDLSLLISGLRPLRNVAMTPLVSEDIYLVGPPDAGLDPAQPVPIEEVAQLPMVMFAPRNHLRWRAETELARRGLALDIAVEVEGNEVMLDLVHRGLGYTLQPFCGIQERLRTGRLSGAPVEDMSVTWTLGVSQARPNAPAVRELERMVREAVDERVDSGEWQVVRPGRRASGSR